MLGSRAPRDDGLVQGVNQYAFGPAAGRGEGLGGSVVDETEQIGLILIRCRLLHTVEN